MAIKIQYQLRWRIARGDLPQTQNFPMSEVNDEEAIGQAKAFLRRMVDDAGIQVISFRCVETRDVEGMPTRFEFSNKFRLSSNI